MPPEHIEKDKLDSVSKYFYGLAFSERFPRMLTKLFDEHKEAVRRCGYRRNDADYLGIASEIVRAFAHPCILYVRQLAPLPRTATLEEQCRVLFEEKVTSVIEYSFPGWPYAKRQA